MINTSDAMFTFLNVDRLYQINHKALDDQGLFARYYYVM